MRLSRKQKTLSGFFSQFLKSGLNSEHCQKKMILIADGSPQLRTPKSLVRSMSKKSPFKGSFGKQDGKCAQTLSKCQG